MSASGGYRRWAWRLAALTAAKRCQCRGGACVTPSSGQRLCSNPSTGAVGRVGGQPGTPPTWTACFKCGAALNALSLCTAVPCWPVPAGRLLVWQGSSHCTPCLGTALYCTMHANCKWGPTCPAAPLVASLAACLCTPRASSAVTTRWRGRWPWQPRRWRWSDAGCLSSRGRRPWMSTALWPRLWMTVARPFCQRHLCRARHL